MFSPRILSLVALSLSAKTAFCSSQESAPPPDTLTITYPVSAAVGQYLVGGFSGGQFLVPFDSYYGFYYNTSVSFIHPDGSFEPTACP